MPEKNVNLNTQENVGAVAEETAVTEAAAETEENTEADEAQAIEMRRFREQTGRNMEEMTKAFKELRCELTAYVEDVRKALYEPFLRRLAVLCQDMQIANDGFSMRLGEILSDMGMQPILPEKGDRFDSVHFIRERNDTYGMKVNERIATGWKNGDKLLVGALVSTVKEGADDQ